ncbi:MAG: TetR/AcrR family transcriptional regulator [Flavobacteriaceae bacterium]
MSERKKEIIATAEILFKEKGYSAVTMRDIALEMGIKAASLYNHIKSKQEILSIIILSLAEEFTSGMTAIVTSNKTTVEQLQDIISLHVAITTNHPHGMASLNADWMHLEEQLEYYLKLRENYENNFRQVIVKGIANNEISDMNPEVILFSILSTLRSLYLWIPKKEEVDLKVLDANLSHVLLKGVVV